MPTTAPRPNSALSVRRYEDAGRRPRANLRSPGSAKPRPMSRSEMARHQTAFGQRVRVPRQLTRNKPESLFAPPLLKAGSIGPGPCSCLVLTSSQLNEKFCHEILEHDRAIHCCRADIIDWLNFLDCRVR